MPYFGRPGAIHGSWAWHMRHEHAHDPWTAAPEPWTINHGPMKHGLWTHVVFGPWIVTRWTMGGNGIQWAPMGSNGGKWDKKYMRCLVTFGLFFWKIILKKVKKLRGMILLQFGLIKSRFYYVRNQTFWKFQKSLKKYWNPSGIVN